MTKTLRSPGVLKDAISASFLVMRKRPRARHIRLKRRAINDRGVAGVNQLLGLTRQRHDIVSDDADADVVKVIVRKAA